MSENRCVCCGEIIPEGKHVCIRCEMKAEKDYNAPEYVPKGWVCPVCKRVYAPDWPFCTFCNNKADG